MKDKKAIKAAKRLRKYVDRFVTCEDGCAFLVKDGLTEYCLLGVCASEWSFKKEKE